MLPMTVLRRFDCVLEPTKQAVLKRHARLKDSKVKNFDPILNDIAKDATGQIVQRAPRRGHHRRRHGSVAYSGMILAYCIDS